MTIKWTNQMVCLSAGTYLPIAKHTFSIARRSIILLPVLISFFACATPDRIGIPEEPTGAKPVGRRSESTSVESDLPIITYTIQVGAFSASERAVRLSQTLKRHGLDAYYFIDSDGLCKVRFERFETKETAHRRALELQSMGYIDRFYIVKPGSEKPATNPQLILRRNIVQTAQRFVGTSYRWGGESVNRGFDCSGLTMTVYRLNGLELPRNSRSQFRVGKPIERDALRMGDLVFFSTNRRNRVSHVGVYTGYGKFIHAPGRGKRIRTSSMTNGYFSRRYMGARRYF
jgi:hypothetical protein